MIRSPVSLSSDHTFHMHPFYVTVWMELICALRLSREPQWALFTVKLWPGRVFIANHQTVIINISWLHAIFPSKIKANKLITWKDGKGLLNRLKFRRVKRQIKKIWNNDFSLLFVWLNFLVKLELIFFSKPFIPSIRCIHITDIFYFSCLSLHIWQWVMFLAAIIWDKSLMLWDTAMPMTSFTETSSPTACCLRARRTPPPSNSEGSVWPLRSLRAVWFLEVCLNLLG